MKDKIVISSLGGLYALLKNAPDVITTSMYVVFLLLAADMITGVIAAGACKQLRSQTMRTKLVLKLCSYALILVITFAGTVVTSTWLFYGGGVLAIGGIEISSMMENLTRWQKYSRINLGKVGQLLTGVAGYFEVNQEGIRVQEVTKTETNVPNHPGEPVVSTSVTERSIGTSVGSSTLESISSTTTKGGKI